MQCASLCMIELRVRPPMVALGCNSAARPTEDLSNSIVWWLGCFGVACNYKFAPHPPLSRNEAMRKAAQKG